MMSPVVLALTAACLFTSTTVLSDTVVTIRDGSWHDPAIWSGSTVPAASSEIVINHLVSLTAALAVEAQSVSIAGHLVLEAGALLQLSGPVRVLQVTGILECADGSLLNGTTEMNAIFDAGARYIHRQGPLGYIPLATWHVESTFQISGFIDDGYINLAHSSSWRQSFGNVEYDCPAQTVFIVDLNGHLRDIRGNLTIRNTNNKALRLTTTQQSTINIGGSLTIEGPTQVWFTTNSANCTVTIGGDFLYRSEGSAASYLATRGNIRLVVAGDLIIDSQNVLRMASSAADSTGSRQATVLLGGDFRILRGSLVAPPPQRGRGTIEFKGPSTQRVEIGRIGTPLVGNLSYILPAGVRVNLGESVLFSEMGSLEVGGTLELGSTDSGGVIQLGNAGGNIRIPGTRNFRPNSRIIYNGSAPQVLGDGHPSESHCVLDNPTGFAQIHEVAITGDLTILRGSVTQSGFALTVGGNVELSGVDVHVQNLHLSGSNNQTINGSGATIDRLEIHKTAGDVDLSSALSLTNLLQIATGGIEFDSNGFLTLTSSGDVAGSTSSIGAIPPGSSVVGNVTVQRFMSGEGRLYRYLSSPVTNATVASLMDDFPVTGRFVDPSAGQGIVSTSPSLYDYDESKGLMQQGWREYPLAVTAAEAPLKVGHGYAAFVRNQTSTILDFFGPVNQGVVHLPLGYTTHNGTGNGWHLVGNPYPSAIDWDASALDKVALSHVIAIRDNGERRFRYWDGDNQYADVPDGKIASGQSFWVRATSPGASLTFREEAKTVDASFYRRPVVQIPSLRISVTDGQVSDHTILKLRPQSSDSLDVWDGLKLLNDTLNISTMAIGGGRLAIDSRPALPDSINLVLTDLQPGRYSLMLSAHESLRHLVCYVKDYYLKQTVRLNSQDSLEFVVTDTASARAGRFSIHLVNHSWPKRSQGTWHVGVDSLGIDRRATEGSPKEPVTDQHFLSATTEPMSTYPNPVSTELTVEFSYEDGDEVPTASQLQVLLYNAVGMRVDPQSFVIRYQMERDLPGELLSKRFVRFILSVENLSPGTYLLRVDCGRQTNWVRFAKT